MIPFMGQRGASIKSFRELAAIAHISAYVPNIVTTLLEGNDLDGKFPPPPEAVGSQLCILGDELLTLGFHQVCLCQTERRNKWHHFDFETAVACISSANAVSQTECGGARAAYMRGLLFFLCGVCFLSGETIKS